MAVKSPVLDERNDSIEYPGRIVVINKRARVADMYLCLENVSGVELNMDSSLRLGLG